MSVREGRLMKHNMTVGDITRDEYDTITFQGEGIYIVSVGKKYGIYHKIYGGLVIPCEYDGIKYSGENIAMVMVDGLWGAMGFGEAENVRIPIQYLDIERVGHNRFHVKKKYEKTISEKINETPQDSSEFSRNITTDHEESEQQLTSQYQSGIDDKSLVNKVIVNNTPYDPDDMIEFDDGISLPACLFIDDILPENNQNIYKEPKYETRIEEYIGYSIVDQTGKRLCYEVDKSLKPIIYLSDDTMIAFDGYHYGIACIDGYWRIPTKYDQIIPRVDGYFDVMIKSEDCDGDEICLYGVMDSMGREIIPVVFDERFPLEQSDAILFDPIKDKFAFCRIPQGVIAAPLYDGIIVSKKCILFGYERREIDRIEKAYYCYVSDYNRKKKYSHKSEKLFGIAEKWGCMSMDGDVIIPAKHDSFEFGDSFIISRDYGYNNHLDQCNMYSATGELLVGGFNDYKIVVGNYIKLYIGGQKERCEQYLHGELIEIDYDYDCSKGCCVEVCVNDDLQSVHCDENGNYFSIPKGFVMSITEQKIEGKKVRVANFPLSIAESDWKTSDGKYLLSLDEKQKDDSSYQEFSEYDYEDSPYRGSYAREVRGWSDDMIDDILDGDPDLIWNID